MQCSVGSILIYPVFRGFFIHVFYVSFMYIESLPHTTACLWVPLVSKLTVFLTITQRSVILIINHY